MTDPNAITPPPELVQQWLGEYFGCDVKGEVSIPELHLAARAARWGADQELEACCEWLPQRCSQWVTVELRTARRSKSSSLKQQSLALLDLIQGNKKSWMLEDLNVIRRALEQLDD